MDAPFAEYEGLAVYESPGNKDAVLWVHGYTMDSTVWSDLWSMLPGWRHIGVDLPAHGRSRPFLPGETLPQLGRTLASLAASLGARHLTGMSFGSMVALQTAIEADPPFATITIGSPALAGGPTDPHAATQNLKRRQLYRRDGAGQWMRESWMQWPPDIFKGASAHPRLWKQLVDIISRHTWSEIENLAIEKLVSCRQTHEQLASVRSSTLIIVGEDDMRAFKRSADLIRRSIPACDRVYVSECGHLSLVERPETAAPLLSAHWTRGLSR